MTQRQEHVQKLDAMMEEYSTTKSTYRKADLRKGIKRLQKELQAYDRYMGDAHGNRQT